MSTKRLIWFGISVFVGLFLGLMLGWSTKPLAYRNLTSTTLREDYRVDYVLMTAEIYKTTGNVTASINQLKLLDPGTKPLRITQTALLNARKYGYPLYDMELIGKLVQAIEETD
mgnify:FL=1